MGAFMSHAEDSLLLPISALDAMSRAMKELTVQMTLLNSRFVESSSHTQHIADPVWWDEMQTLATEALTKAGELTRMLEDGVSAQHDDDVAEGPLVVHARTPTLVKTSPPDTTADGAGEAPS
jgi:hypothetical protein